MTVIATYGDKVEVFQFSAYSVSIDVMQKSRRYGTREAIQKIVGGNILFGSKCIIDKSIIELPNTDIAGLTPIDFNPETT